MAGNRAAVGETWKGVQLPRRFAPAVALCLTAVLGSGCGDADNDAGSVELRGIEQVPAPQVGAVSLPDASNGGAPFSFRAADGELLLAYFGYTSCPDVCPTTMSDLRRALEAIDGDPAEVTVAFATVDPARDTDEIVTGYVQSFVDGAHGLRSEEDEELRAAADAFGADYSITNGDDGPEVSHTGFLYAVDEAGSVVVTWPFGTPAEDLAHDIDALLERADA